LSGASLFWRGEAGGERGEVPDPLDEESAELARSKVRVVRPGDPGAELLAKVVEP